MLSSEQHQRIMRSRYHVQCKMFNKWIELLKNKGGYRILKDRFGINHSNTHHNNKTSVTNVTTTDVTTGQVTTTNITQTNIHRMSSMKLISYVYYMAINPRASKRQDKQSCRPFYVGVYNHSEITAQYPGDQFLRQAMS